MRKPVQIVLIVVIVVLVGALAVLFQSYWKTSAEYAQTKTAEETARIQYTEVVSAIGEIQDSLSAIAVGDSSVQALSQQLQTEGRPSAPDRQQALNQIALVTASIQRAKVKIGELETRLKKSNRKVAGLEKLVANLKQTVAEKEASVAMLTAQVDTLQTRVTGLTAEVEENQETIRAREQTIEEKRRELGTVYFVVGTKEELSKAGIITARGGLLGLGKTLTLSGVVNEQLFTPIDTDQERTVRTRAAKLERVQVLSPQPVTSYELRLVGDQVELHILDPVEFRKVKHLVIMTRQTA